MNQTFHEHVIKKAVEIYGSDLSAIEDRLLRELDYVETFGFEKELLAAELLAQSYKDRYIPFLVGGLIGSLCLSYILGITEVDPIKYNIPYEMAVGYNGDKIPSFVIEHNGSGILSVGKNINAIPCGILNNASNNFLIIKDFDDQKVWEYISCGNYKFDFGSSSKEFSELVERFKPTSIELFAKTISVCLSTGLYPNNIDNIANDYHLEINDLPTTREDFIELFIEHGLLKEKAFAVMSYIQTGRSIPVELMNILDEMKFPDWFAPLTQKIVYLLPRSYCLELAIFTYKTALSSLITT